MNEDNDGHDVFTSIIVEEYTAVYDTHKGYNICSIDLYHKWTHIVVRHVKEYKKSELYV